MNYVILQEEPRGPSILIEVAVTTSGQQRIPFPDISQLRNTTDLKIIIKSLRLVTPQVLTNGVVNGGVCAPQSELQKMTITLYAEGWEKGQTIPIMFLNDVNNPGSAIAHKYTATNFSNWVNVDWPKSYIQFANGTTSDATTPYVVMLDCLYVRVNASNNILVGPAK
jgi:hypothetical protein